MYVNRKWIRLITVSSSSLQQFLSGTRKSSWESSRFPPRSIASRLSQRLQCIRPCLIMRWRGTNWHQMKSHSMITKLQAETLPLPAESEEPNQLRAESKTMWNSTLRLMVEAVSGIQWAPSLESNNLTSKNQTFEAKAIQSPNTEMKMRLAVSLLPPLPFSSLALLHYWNSSNLWIFGSSLHSS